MLSSKLERGEAFFEALYGGLIYGGIIFFLFATVVSLFAPEARYVSSWSEVIFSPYSLALMACVSIATSYGYRNLRRAGNFFG